MKGIAEHIGDPPAFGYLLELMQAGNYDEAEVVAEALIERYPDHAEAMYHLGIIWAYRDNAFGGAATWLAQATKLRPDWAEAHYNAGYFSQRLGETGLSHAKKFYTRALELQPTMAAALTNLGTLALGEGEREKAIELLTRASASKDEEPLARYNRAMAYLLTGRWSEGWQDYEQRLYAPFFRRNLAPFPIWDGSPMPGKTLLIDSDQGLGDVIMCLRWHKAVQQKFQGNVIWRVQPPLASLIPNIVEGGHQIGVTGVLDTGTLRSWSQFDDGPYPKADVSLPVMSLPHRMGARPDHTLWQPPLLPWSDWTRPSKDDELPIGLCWAGSVTHENDRYRSLPKAAVDRLMRLTPRHGWRSLQVGPRADWVDLPAPMFTTFYDTAVAILGCRIVITVDTAIAHLAGALGVPCWNLLSAFPDYRWMLDRQDTPWYPAMSLIRQKAIGNWDSVIDEVEKNLSYRSLLA